MYSGMIDPMNSLVLKFLNLFEGPRILISYKRVF